MENKIYSLENQISDWKKENRPGLVQFIFTLVVIIIGGINGSIDEIQPPVLQVILILTLLFVAVLAGYLLKRVITPSYIKEAEKELADLEELRYRQFLFWE